MLSALTSLLNSIGGTSSPVPGSQVSPGMPSAGVPHSHVPGASALSRDSAGGSSSSVNLLGQGIGQYLPPVPPDSELEALTLAAASMVTHDRTSSAMTDPLDVITSVANSGPVGPLSDDGGRGLTDLAASLLSQSTAQLVNGSGPLSRSATPSPATVLPMPGQYRTVAFRTIERC